MVRTRQATPTPLPINMITTCMTAFAPIMARTYGAGTRVAAARLCWASVVPIGHRPVLVLW
jgi:hypothetical protein